jgi:hypothetical protein
MDSWADESPEDSEPDPGFDYDRFGGEIERECERTWHVSAPFSDPREIANVALVEVYGDEEAAWRLRASAQSRSQREQALSEVRLRRLSGDDLRAMCNWDRENYFEDCHRACEVYGCGDWHQDNGEHDDLCPLSKYCGQELEMHGLVLHRRAPTFWERVRKLGATPEIVTQANAILHPLKKEVKRSARQNLSACNPRRRTRARSRGRRSAPVRRVRTASRGSPGDEPEPGESPRRADDDHVDHHVARVSAR